MTESISASFLSLRLISVIAKQQTNNTANERSYRSAQRTAKNPAAKHGTSNPNIFCLGTFLLGTLLFGWNLVGDVRHDDDLSENSTIFSKRFIGERIQLSRSGVCFNLCVPGIRIEPSESATKLHPFF